MSASKIEGPIWTLSIITTDPDRLNSTATILVTDTQRIEFKHLISNKKFSFLLMTSFQDGTQHYINKDAIIDIIFNRFPDPIDKFDYYRFETL
jgi:hypothetical protein